VWLRPYTRAEVEAQQNWFHDARQIKFTLFQRYGILAAAGDRTCQSSSPALPAPPKSFRWGIIRTPVTWRIATWRQGEQAAHEYLAGQRKFELGTSGEEAIRQIKALLGLAGFHHYVNRLNSGQAPDLPEHVVVETNARFSRDRVEPLPGRPALPPGVHALVARPRFQPGNGRGGSPQRGYRPGLPGGSLTTPPPPCQSNRAWELFRGL